MYPSKKDEDNTLAEREAEIPSLLSSQRAHLEEQQMLTDRLNSKLEPVMIPCAPTKGGADVARPTLTGIGNLIDRANQEISATNCRLREMLDRLAI